VRSDPLADKAAVVASACAELTRGDAKSAARLLETGYPFVPLTKVSRRYTERQSLGVFYRDGFVDRYSGDRLVHPGALRLLSLILPEQFPAHPNWEMRNTHLGFWELFPSIDHVVPVGRGGADTAENWATTSMLRNSAKAHWTLGDLGWTLLPPGDLASWNGLSDWYVDYLTDHPALAAAHPYLRRWFAATVAVRAGPTSSD
jgi:hypothetical protein